MNWVDYTFIGIVVLSLLVGVWRGLVREALSLAALIAAFLVSGLYGPDVTRWLTSAINSPLARSASAHILVFVAVLLLGALLTWAVSRLVDAAGLTSVNRLFGAGFGVLRGLLILVAFVLVARMTTLRDEPVLQASMLRPLLDPLATTLQETIPSSWLAWLGDDGHGGKPVPET